MSSTSHIAKPRKRGPYKKAYTNDQLLQALDSCTRATHAPRTLTFKEAAAQHGIPESTLRDYHRRTRAAIASSPRHAVPQEVVEATVSSVKSGKPQRMLTDEVEDKLKAWIDACGDVAEPPSVALIRLKAKRLWYVAQGIAVTAENEAELASWKWYRGYKKRYPTLCARKPTPLSTANAKATQPEIINHFYALLKYQLDTYRFSPDQIYAADETSVAGDQKVGKVVGDKGTHTHAKYQHTRAMFALTPYAHVSNLHHFCVQASV
jgi:hypothetical protein